MNKIMIVELKSMSMILIYNFRTEFQTIATVPLLRILTPSLYHITPTTGYAATLPDILSSLPSSISKYVGSRFSKNPGLT